MLINTWGRDDNVASPWLPFSRTQFGHLSFGNKQFWRHLLHFHWEAFTEIWTHVTSLSEVSGILKKPSFCWYYIIYSYSRGPVLYRFSHCEHISSSTLPQNIRLGLKWKCLPFRRTQFGHLSFGKKQFWRYLLHFHWEAFTEIWTHVTSLSEVPGIFKKPSFCWYYNI